MGKVLDQIGAKDSLCREHILQSRRRLWPKDAEDEEERQRAEAEEKEEKKRRAKARQDRMMEDMKKRQNIWMEKAKNELDSEIPNPFLDQAEESNSSDPGDIQIKAVEYDCVICNQTGPSTPSNPIGLIILLQASSLLAHRRSKGKFGRIIFESMKTLLSFNI